MTVSHGFELIRDEEIAEINTRARLWRHVKSGAQLLSLENDDENKVFGVAFRTPPPDSTGIAHIMEHAVLGGSRKYQVKEPFVELIKGSLNTFLNAFTFPDKTIYPVASTNLQDFYNLVEVYLDAVFYPLITPFHLQQEGWHYELENADEPLTFKGIVFNEMKGAYSSPDDRLGDLSQQSLFPDTPYRHDSGGDPAAIPDLTYAQFKAFHETYYHPSNAWIFLYGDDDPAQRLIMLDAYLQDFDAIDVASTAVPLQLPFDAPRQLTHPYVVEQTDGEAPKAMVQVNWLLPEYADATEVMALEVLSYALVSTPASPLRKVLIDSGLGEDLTGRGLTTWTRQMTFSVGLKGVEQGNETAVENLVLQTLADLAETGFDPDMVEASLNTIEFALRENNTGQFPRGLSLMINALNTWLHGRDPLMPLRYDEPLNAVREAIEADPDYLPGLIGRYLLDNPHRVTLNLEPDEALKERQEAAERSRLAAVKAGLDSDDLQDIIDNTAELRRRQEAPDDPAELAKLPVLTLADLDKEDKPIPVEVSSARGAQILVHDLFTNGIVYLDIGFDLRTLPQDLLPYAGLIGSVLLEMGTRTEDFVKLSQRIGRKTGGITAPKLTAPRQGSRDGVAYQMLRGKATLAQAQDLLDILRDVLLTVELDNRERFRQIVLETKAAKESNLVPAGHIIVNTRLKAHFSTADWVTEQFSGVESLFFVRRLAEEIEQDWDGVRARLTAVLDHLVNRNAMVCNVTLDADSWAVFQPQLDAFLAELPARAVVCPEWTPAVMPAFEGLTIPAQVNYVAKGANLYELGYTLDGSIAVITNTLRTTYLWEKIRVQGGAYGGFCAFSKQAGVFSYLSYRDPNLLGTLANYDGTADFLRGAAVSDSELTKSIIGTIGTIDAYQLPDARGYTSLMQHLVGESDADRQRFRDQVLSTTAADFHALADVLAQVNAQGHVVVLGSADAIGAANAQGLGLSLRKVM